MRRTLAAIAAALALTLTACTEISPGTGTGPPAPTTYPYLEVADYEYTLEIHCYCPHSGEPIRVTVRGGSPVSGVFLEDGDGGIRAGDVADDFMWLTLNDVIAAANDDKADWVSVSWPPCQQWPDRVAVDPGEDTFDEEYGYTVADVEMGDHGTPPGCAPSAMSAPGPVPALGRFGDWSPGVGVGALQCGRDLGPGDRVHS